MSSLENSQPALALLLLSVLIISCPRPKTLKMAKLWKIFLFYLVCTSVFLAAAVYGVEEEETGEEKKREADRVSNLPGQPPVTFRHYAGYVRLRPNDQKALFYWFFEAQDNVSQKPLVLWLNGGPGCSSVAFGAAQELGPFLVRRNVTELILNKYSWNKAANLLFLEAPVGVGFSYTNNSQDLRKLGDRVTADDSHAFLINWFKRFPEFKSHDFFMAGESYAGHYVPQLAELIYERNKGATKNSYINFKGFMIGNAVINDETDLSGILDYAWSHAIISDKLYHSVKECSKLKESFAAAAAVNNCSVHFGGFMEAYSNIDMYSIYTPVCLDDASQASKKISAGPRQLTMHDLWRKLPSGYDPCTEGYAVNFFNREDVQRALHANVTKMSYPYTPCSHVIEKWNDSPDTVLPVLHKLLKAGIRIWVYRIEFSGRRLVREN
ncbi:serine carboxypeptidase-like 35 isoform X3 [Ricinus communis]|uniref:serine carboxypeptidase-like 35 isoform X3 n=1 Tax=Ricinus communis TaxID=3988 RepID=UPI00201B185B|nr:serine carboxypeptidase-like 35 isoform X3 [Ricinus communis]